MKVMMDYELFDGSIVQVEVEEEVKAAYQEILHEEKRCRWREHKRGDVSLEGLFEKGIDIADPVHRNPEEMFTGRKEMMLSALVGLTEYQKRVAMKFYLEQKTHSEIAREEGVSQPAISNLLKKIKHKIISQFI